MIKEKTHSSALKTASTEVNDRVKRSYSKGKKRVIRYGLFGVNVLLVLAVVGFIIATRGSGSAPQNATVRLTTEQEITNPLDTLSGADIATNVAELVHLEQAVAVRNNADSVNTQLDIVPNDAQVVAKPQIVRTDLKSIRDLKEYEAVDGDTITSIAEKFGIKPQTLRWSNDLTGDSVNVGAKLKVPPVDGFVYTVKEGDTAKSIADKYSASEDKIIAFNDAEITGLKTGQEIVIPDGEIPAPVARTNSFASVSGFRYGFTATYGGNGYSAGYCTWHAANRRAQVGKPIPANLGNASTWKARASLAGLGTGSTPAKYAVLWHPPRDYYGHVAFVEDVLPDGSILVSDMNYPIWGAVTTRVLTPAQAAAYQYIY